MEKLFIDIMPIYSFMRVNKLTKQKMSELCNISYASLKKILNQDISFKLEALNKIAKVMNMELRLFFL